MTLSFALFPTIENQIYKSIVFSRLMFISRPTHIVVILSVRVPYQQTDYFDVHFILHIRLKLYARSRVIYLNLDKLNVACTNLRNGCVPLSGMVIFYFYRLVCSADVP